MIRAATSADIPALHQMEQRCFQGDRIGTRSFRYLISRAHARVLVSESAGSLQGYVVVLFRRGVSMARLYSIAVDETARGQGVAADLVGAAEQAALDEGVVEMRLEVRQDNTASQQLFRGLGYRPFGTYARYYEDAADALRYHRYLTPARPPTLAAMPYYAQTLDFTCGPACLMMAMNSLQPGCTMDRRLELRLWRESTTVFMTTGHGGCGPHGLALAAHRRGFPVSLLLASEGPLFLSSVRSSRKRSVMQLVQEDFIEEATEQGIARTIAPVRPQDLAAAREQGTVPLVLISSFRLYGEKSPHWVVMNGMDERFVYLMDPFVDEAGGRSTTDCLNMPVPVAEFDRMARYGRSGEQAAVLVRSPERLDA